MQEHVDLFDEENENSNLLIDENTISKLITRCKDSSDDVLIKIVLIFPPLKTSTNNLIFFEIKSRACPDSQQKNTDPDGSMLIHNILRSYLGPNVAS